MTENAQAPYITAYSYDPETNEYKGETRAYISPREGTYPLPANATLSEPPAIVERKARCWNEEVGAWEQVDDYRGATYWNKATKERVEIKELGTAPTAEMTDIEPTDMQSEWDEATSAWKVPFAVLKERKKAEIWGAGDAILAQVKANFTQAEIESWSKQEQGAKDIQAGNTSTEAAQFVAAIAQGRGIDVSVLVAKILANVASYGALSAAVIGEQQRLDDLIKAATTQADLDAIVWTFAPEYEA